MPTYAAAVNSMFARLKAPWEASTAAIVGYVPDVRWPLVNYGDIPPLRFWARVTQQNHSETQSTLARPARFTVLGNLLIDIQGPATLPSTSNLLRQLGEVAKSAYIGVSEANGVWYRQTFLREMPAQENWYSIRVQCNYQYDELR